MELIHYGATEFRQELFKPVKNWFNKPKGGIWASPVDSKWGWKDWCIEEQFRDCEESNSFRFTLSEDCKLFVIDSFDDLMKMPFIKMGPRLNLLIPDFEKFMIADGIDAIHLTEKGLWKTRLTTPGLYGWDCESVLIMNHEVIQLNKVKA